MDKDSEEVKKQAKGAHALVQDLFKEPIPDVIYLKHGIPDYSKAINYMLNVEDDVKMLLGSNPRPPAKSKIRNKK